MAASLSDILGSLQQGVQALNNLAKQVKGSLLNIQGKLPAGTASANTVFAGPTSGPSGAPAFRALVASDLPGTSITNSLSANVTMNSAGTYFDGPSIAQGATGTWFASGTVTVFDTVASSPTFNVKLWDGTTVIASAEVAAPATGFPVVVALSGFLTSPAGNIKISVSESGTHGVIAFNSSGNSKDSTITAFRIK